MASDAVQLRWCFWADGTVRCVITENELDTLTHDDSIHELFVISQSKEPAIEKVERYQKSSESDTENDPPVTITITSADGDDAMTYDKKRRRSSSWATKMERRRRKGLPAMSGEIDYNGTANGQYDEYARQKRHSWWNIFVPEKNR